MFNLQKTFTKCTILILCGQLQIIKIAEALGHGDMIVTTEATESDKGKDAGDTMTDEWTSFKDFWKDSMHIWIFLLVIAVILAFMVCCCCCIPSTFCCACCPILTNLFALFKSNNDSKRSDRGWEDHRQTSRQEQIIYRKPIKQYRQELIITDESAYETDRDACYEKNRRRRPLRKKTSGRSTPSRSLFARISHLVLQRLSQPRKRHRRYRSHQSIPMTPVSTPSRSTIRNEKSISSVSSHENCYSDPNRYTPKAGGQLYPNIP